MKVYVNCITSGAELSRDIKELIPEMNLRRRMSRVVKSGVAAGIESLLEFGGRAPVDAIVTATGLGCIADSEKFLDGLIANQEQMLNPTPFIQSTFNTVGAQIALLRGLHGYNSTYAHRWTSFENALTDAALRIGAGLSRAVLVGAFDQTTPSVEKVLQRLRVAPKGAWGESSVFFVLTAERFDCSVAAITAIRIPAGAPAADDGCPANGWRTGQVPETVEIGSGMSCAAGPGEKMREEKVCRDICIGESGMEIKAVRKNTQIEEPGEKESAENTATGDSRIGEPSAETRAAEGNSAIGGACEEIEKEITGQENACIGQAGAEASEGRAIRASQTGVKPHFTAIAEVFRQAVAKNAGHKITLYNDFSGRTESAIDLICM